MMTTTVRRFARAAAALLALTVGIVGTASTSDGSVPAATGHRAAAVGYAHASMRHEAHAAHRALRNPHFFSSPSRNIGCYVTAQVARCDIAEHTWHAPRRPASCQADWGNGMYLRAKSHWVCASDTVLGARRILHYGHFQRFGAMKCISRRSGMICRNLSTGHGFRLARQSYSRF
jgi:hypothetical protein